MNSKARFIPLIVLGAIVLSLIAIIPVLSATGQLQFGHGGSDDEQEWAMQGGMVELQVEDSDLDQPVKYVLLPVLDLQVLSSVNSDGCNYDLGGDPVAVAATSSSAVIMVGSL